MCTCNHTCECCNKLELFVPKCTKQLQISTGIISTALIINFKRNSDRVRRFLGDTDENGIFTFNCTLLPIGYFMSKIKYKIWFEDLDSQKIYFTSDLEEVEEIDFKVVNKQLIYDEQLNLNEFLHKLNF